MTDTLWIVIMVGIPVLAGGIVFADIIRHTRQAEDRWARDLNFDPERELRNLQGELDKRYRVVYAESSQAKVSQFEIKPRVEGRRFREDA